jgi:hypothetical protein
MCTINLIVTGAEGVTQVVCLASPGFSHQHGEGGGG